MQPPGSLSKEASTPEEWLQLRPVSPCPGPFQEPPLVVLGGCWWGGGGWRLGPVCVVASPGPRVRSLSALAPQRYW